MDKQKRPILEIDPETLVGMNLADVLRTYEFSDIVSPVINRENKIVGFIWESDPVETFQGEDINDLGLQKIEGVFVYKI